MVRILTSDGRILRRTRTGETNSVDSDQNTLGASCLLSSGFPIAGKLVAMKLTIELDREVDGRWIAEVPELNVLLYGDSKQDAIQRAQSAAREIVLDWIAQSPNRTHSGRSS